MLLRTHSGETALEDAIKQAEGLVSDKALQGCMARAASAEGLPTETQWWDNQVAVNIIGRWVPAS